VSRSWAKSFVYDSFDNSFLLPIKANRFARPGTQSLGFSLRSAQAAEEERHRLVHAGTVAFPGVCDASRVFVSFVVP